MVQWSKIWVVVIFPCCTNTQPKHIFFVKLVSVLNTFLQFLLIYYIYSVNDRVKINESDRNGWCWFTSSSDRLAGNLECHLRIHSGERPFCCGQCHQTFAQKAELRRHMLSHIGSGGGFLCSYCGKSLRDPHSLKSHERLHTGERPHRCSICDKGQKGKRASRVGIKNSLDGVTFTCTNIAFIKSFSCVRGMYVNK